MRFHVYMVRSSACIPATAPVGREIFFPFPSALIDLHLCHKGNRLLPPAYDSGPLNDAVCQDAGKQETTSYIVSEVFWEASWDGTNILWEVALRESPSRVLARLVRESPLEMSLKFTRKLPVGGWPN